MELLKAAGHNAVRTAHNPPSSGFLDACDRLGLLVLDEPFDMWKASKVKFDYGTRFRRMVEAGHLGHGAARPQSSVHRDLGNRQRDPRVGSGKRRRDSASSLPTRCARSTTRARLPWRFQDTTKPTAQAVFSQLDITGYNYNIIPDLCRRPSAVASSHHADHRIVSGESVSAVAGLPGQSICPR